MVKEEFESTENVETDLNAAILESTLVENLKLRTTIERLNRQQLSLRDTVAVSVFPSFLAIDFKAEIAAEDSYKAADALMRVRDRGRSYEDDLIEIIKTFAKLYPNDYELGSAVRSFLNNKP